MAAIKLRNFTKFTYTSRIILLKLFQPTYHCNTRTGTLMPILINQIHTTTRIDVHGLPINMPSLSPTMMEGTIVKWLKSEGDAVQPGDVLCDIQTDKAVVSLETDEEGILAKIVKGNDSKDIKVGTLIALMVEEGEDWKSVVMPSLDDAADLSQTATLPGDNKQLSIQKDTRYNFGPSVRLLLEKYGLPADKVPAQGPHGKLLKGDILRYVKASNIRPKVFTTIAPPKATSKDVSLPHPPTATVISGDKYDDLELTNMRRTIAKRLTQSKSMVAHTYSTLECSMDKVLELRKKFKSDGISLSVNDFIIKSVAVALNRCPDINCIWENGHLTRKDEVDISVAVATDAGLITPIVKGADSLRLEDISSRVRELALKAKENKLRLNEFQGGTFTISNLGMFGIKEFTAIINTPQCGILAVGGSLLALNENGIAERRMRATLSYDQAAISDDSAAIFLQTLKQILEDPQQILLGSYPKNLIKHPLAALL